MASTKSQLAGPSYSDRDYQCEEDVRNLQRSAEVLADKGRAKKALKKFKMQQVGGDRLVDALSGTKLKRG